MQVMLVVGARPNFMKIASIIDAIKTYNHSTTHPISYLLVHTGQHYDHQMSQAFFKNLALPQPHIDLEVGSLSHAHQTAEIMKRFEPILLKEQPHVVLVVGDVNSTIACSLVASKITYDQATKNRRHTRPLLAHVEAGLRSFDRSMPEEINRILTDVLADFLFVTEESGKENLLREGIPKEKIYLVGNTMVDTLLKHRKRTQNSKILFRLGLNIDSNHAFTGNSQHKNNINYALVTLHRPSNVDKKENFQKILEALSVIAKRLPLIFPAHPRTMSRIRAFGFERYFVFMNQSPKFKISNSGIYCFDSLDYYDFICIMSHANLILTDSGGIQEESTILGIPCVTIRQNTERPVTVSEGTNILAGTEREKIVHHAFSQLNKFGQLKKLKKPKFWDGHAGERIVKILTQQVQKTNAGK